MDITNQIQNGNIQLTSGNSNYSDGSGDDSPTSLSPGKTKRISIEIINVSFLKCPCHPVDNMVVLVVIQIPRIVQHLLQQQVEE